MVNEETDYDPEPRWPAFIAIISVGGIYISLPESLLTGPRWVLPVLIAVLTIPAMVTHRKKLHHLNAILGFIISSVLTLSLVASLWLLVRALPAHKETPLAMLVSAASLWITNILVFALWYWRLDAGGPHHREKKKTHVEGAFLFPQMTIGDDKGRWSPNFVDYLFLAFNTSTAFSPTDAPVMYRWAKILMMLQSLISLMIIVLLAARAVNIL